MNDKDFVGQSGNDFIATLRRFRCRTARAVLERGKEEQAAGVHSAAPVSPLIFRQFDPWSVELRLIRRPPAPLCHSQRQVVAVAQI